MPTLRWQPFVAAAIAAVAAVAGPAGWAPPAYAEAAAWWGLGAASPRSPFEASGPVDPSHIFGFQAVPKYDEAKQVGAWTGSRTRGLALHRALGVDVSREGFIWRHYEPSAGAHPTQADFDDGVGGLTRAGIAIQAMITETPRWASTAAAATVSDDPLTWKSAPPRGLALPIFADGTDVPGPGKRANPQNAWAVAVEHMVRRYKGKVRYWQMWNEPDYPQGDQGLDFKDKRRSWNGSLDDYVRLLRTGWAIVQVNDPGARVVTGGIGFAGYLDAMLQRGAGQWLDQVDFHAYGWPTSDTALDAFVRVHDQLRAVMDKQGLQAKRLICSETGYTANEPAIQAEYAAKLYPTSLALGLETTIWYANVNPSWHQMGLVDWRTLSQRTPGWWAYRTAATALGDVTAVEPLGVAGARGFRFRRKSGSGVIVAWAPRKAGEGPLSVTLPLGRGSWTMRDMLGRHLGKLQGRATLALTTAPVWLDADAGRAYVAIAANPPLKRSGLLLARATADSANTQVGGAPAAIDNDFDSQWACGQRGQTGAWLRLDLAEAAMVGAVKLKTGPTPAGTWFDVETSADGKTFVPAIARARLDSWQLTTLGLPRPVKAKAVRLAWRNPEGRQASFGVFEVELHP